MSKKTGHRSRSTNKTVKYSTQRVDIESIVRIKTLNYRLLKAKELRLSQAEVIGWAVRFALSREADFQEYTEKGVDAEKETR